MKRQVSPRSRWSRWNRSSTWAWMRGRRAPRVTSSQISRSGSAASARASPTRCCWPPESCRGRRSSRSGESAICSISASASTRAADGDIPRWRRNGRARISATVWSGSGPTAGPGGRAGAPRTQVGAAPPRPGPETGMSPSRISARVAGHHPRRSPRRASTCPIRSRRRRPASPPRRTVSVTPSERRRGGRPRRGRRKGADASSKPADGRRRNAGSRSRAPARRRQPAAGRSRPHGAQRRRGSVHTRCADDAAPRPWRPPRRSPPARITRRARRPGGSRCVLVAGRLDSACGRLGLTSSFQSAAAPRRLVGAVGSATSRQPISSGGVHRRGGDHPRAHCGLAPGELVGHSDRGAARVSACWSSLSVGSTSGLARRGLREVGSGRAHCRRLVAPFGRCGTCDVS